MIGFVQMATLMTLSWNMLTFLMTSDHISNLELDLLMCSTADSHETWTEPQSSLSHVSHLNSCTIMKSSCKSCILVQFHRSSVWPVMCEPRQPFQYHCWVCTGTHNRPTLVTHLSFYCDPFFVVFCSNMAEQSFIVCLLTGCRFCAHTAPVFLGLQTCLPLRK